MTNEELLKKTFTQEQRNWLAEHGEPVRGTQTEMLSDLAKQLHNAKVYSNKDERVKLVKTINRTGKVYDLQSFATAAGFSSAFPMETDLRGRRVGRRQRPSDGEAWANKYSY